MTDVGAARLLQGMLERDDLQRGVLADVEVALADVERMSAALGDGGLQRAVDALMADSGLPRYGPHRVAVERRQRLAFVAAKQVEAARND